MIIFKTISRYFRCLVAWIISDELGEYMTWRECMERIKEWDKNYESE